MILKVNCPKCKKAFPLTETGKTDSEKAPASTDAKDTNNAGETATTDEAGNAGEAAGDSME